jgi:hypothetical protein
VVDVIDDLDLSDLVKACRGSGAASSHPAMLPGLLVYGHATQVLSPADRVCDAQSNVEHCAQAKIEPLFAMGRCRLHICDCEAGTGQPFVRSCRPFVTAHYLADGDGANSRALLSRTDSRSSLNPMASCI